MDEILGRFVYSLAIAEWIFEAYIFVNAMSWLGYWGIHYLFISGQIKYCFYGLIAVLLTALFLTRSSYLVDYLTEDDEDEEIR